MKDYESIINKEVNNPKFPKFSSEVKKLKETEGGLNSMCELMEKYNQEAISKDKERHILEMLKDNLPESKICKYMDVTLEEISIMKEKANCR